VTIAEKTIGVTEDGGTVNLGLSVTAPASPTATTVTITGLPSYDAITDKLDGKTFSGSSITLTAAQVDSGLTLTSRYDGSGHPSAALTIRARDTIGGFIGNSTPETNTVDDPPASPSEPGADAPAEALLLVNPFRS
jgi:hypothetical protein